MSPVIPAPVPVPLPAPPWLLEGLLVFTFVLHLLPMNLLLGGVVILSVSSFRGLYDSKHREFARRAAQSLPAVAAFTITLGVAPLLFLQVLYGQLFYTSSVLMAWFWLSVVLLVLLGYYGLYWFNLQQAELGKRAAWVMLASAVVFTDVAVVFSRNMNAMLHPQEFYPHFLNGEVGTIFGPMTNSDMARLLHFLVGALGVAGLGSAWLSRMWRNEAPEFARWAHRHSLVWFHAGIGSELLVGLWYLFSLPGGVRGQFLGGNLLSTALMITGIILAIVGLAVVRRSLSVATIAVVCSLGVMAVMRHQVRVAFLNPYFNPSTEPVRGQWSVFALFAVFLVAGIAAVAWMLYAFFRPALPRTG